jgi:hypothetical protein
MDLITAEAPAPVGGTSRAKLAASVLIGADLVSLVGLTWDIQWHSDVGPDTFFTVPHLLLYAGSAISGLVSLLMVLATTAAQRAGRAVDPTVGGRAIRVFGGIFAAPIGYLVAGIGSASFLLYGLWDLWWHSLYGFDAVINSPPHIGLLLSGKIGAIGVLMVFAAARTEFWGRAGVFLQTAFLLTSSAVTVLGLTDLQGTVNWINVGTAFLCVLLVVTAAGFLGRPGGAVITAAVAAVLQAVFWWFSPWAAHAYAAAVGLPVRDYIRGVPVVPALLPMCLVLAAAAMDLVLRAHRRSPWIPVLAGGLGGLIITGCAPVQYRLIYNLPSVGNVVLTCVVGTAFGALAGFLGWRFGGMLRLTSPASVTAPATGPVTVTEGR